MELFTLSNASDTITLFLGFITANIPMVVVIVGTVLGVKYFKSFGNSALKGDLETYSDSKDSDYNDYGAQAIADFEEVHEQHERYMEADFEDPDEEAERSYQDQLDDIEGVYNAEFDNDIDDEWYDEDDFIDWAEEHHKDIENPRVRKKFEKLARKGKL